jgi:hypothetical protein
MTQHIMQGRDAVEVIDELEVMFRTRYETIYAKDPGEENGKAAVPEK